MRALPIPHLTPSMPPRETLEWLEEQTVHEQEPTHERTDLDCVDSEQRMTPTLQALPGDGSLQEEAGSTEKASQGDAQSRRRILHKKRRRRVQFPSQKSKRGRWSIQTLPSAGEHNPGEIPPPLYPFWGPDLNNFLRPDPELSSDSDSDIAPVLFHTRGDSIERPRSEESLERPPSPVPVLVYNDPRTPALVRKSDAAQDIEAQTVLTKKKNELNFRDLLKMATSASSGGLLNAKRVNTGPWWKGPKKMLLAFVGIALVIVAVVLSLDPPWRQRS